MEKGKRVLGQVYPCPFVECLHHPKCCGAGVFSQEGQFVPEITVEQDGKGSPGVFQDPTGRSGQFICNSWVEKEEEGDWS